MRTLFSNLVLAGLCFLNLHAVAQINASSFATKVNFGILNTTFYCAPDDFDGDGKTDIAMLSGTSSQGTLSVFRNTSVPGVIDSSSLGN